MRGARGNSDADTTPILLGRHPGPDVRKLLVPDDSPAHRRPDVLCEASPVLSEVLCRVCATNTNPVSVPFPPSQRGPKKEARRRREALTLVERVIGVGLEEEVLQPDHDGVEVQDGLPVLAEDVEADVPVEVQVRVVGLSAPSKPSPVSAAGEEEGGEHEGRGAPWGGNGLLAGREGSWG